MVTDAQDDTANAVVAGLEHFGVPWARFNQAEFPERAELALHPGDPGAGCLLGPDGDPVPIRDIRTVWIWHPRPADARAGLDGPERTFATEACRCACRSFLDLLGYDRFMVNPPWARDLAGDKAHQLRLAVDAGLRVPETIITNSPARARAFCARFPETVFKLLNPPRIDYGDRARWIGTRLLDRGDLEALEGLRRCPGIFQPRIPKRFDLRVTVVGNRVFAAEIHSQADPRGAVDFRMALAEDPGALPHAVHRLPGEIRERILVLARKLDLVYCAVDMVVTPRGEYVFLEVNPSGQYGWIEHWTGLPITYALVRMLAHGRAA